MSNFTPYWQLCMVIQRVYNGQHVQALLATPDNYCVTGVTLFHRNFETFRNRIRFEFNLKLFHFLYLNAGFLCFNNWLIILLGQAHTSDICHGTSFVAVLKSIAVYILYICDEKSPVCAWVYSVDCKACSTLSYRHLRSCCLGTFWFGNDVGSW